MKRVLLLGGGPAQVQLLQNLAREPLAAASLVLVAPFAQVVHSPMLPGLVAGHYQAGQCQLSLLQWAQAARAAWVDAQVLQLDAATRQLRLSNGDTLDYDVLCLAPDLVIDRDQVPGAREHGLFLRPHEHFVRLLDPLLALARERVLDVVVIGADADGFELALALQHRLAGQGDERARVALVTGGTPPLFGYPQTVINQGLRALARQRVTVFQDEAVRVATGVVQLASGARLACDAPVLAGAGEVPPWLRASGLQVDEQGRVAVGTTLQSLSHPEVLALGEGVCSPAGLAPWRGPPPAPAVAGLALNLRRLVGGGDLQPVAGRTTALTLLACGPGRALAAWGAWSAQGRWLWWCKDRQDRGLVARGTGPAPTQPATPLA